MALSASAVGVLVRRYCGWHVTPVKTHTLRLNGSGAALLRLPTLRLGAILSVRENGVDIDPATLEWSTDGRVFKAGRLPWTDRLGGIVIGLEHGFDEAEMAAFTEAITSVTGHQSGDREILGPFQWLGAEAVVSGSAFTTAEKAIIDLYALEPKP
ncbi:hypothetical protein [Mycobacteroides chelonae]|jgi:hypothetical protein|uniref:ASCH domain-containing protein n=1 Tax=Mycobacteroides chelonae TaxID=1774 RepID=A0AB73U5D2_MYCCH|nr:hypothetical protein [Mycobacteroides chelonae]MEC4842662.1 hypothetical protein [Mycobacteroides chelonae]MEC4847503.1 hypothetical protein [Mycobacteroides chelonae]OLT80575.1 hypothetical protein BKG57_11280 [Mycobacteroides chelonae]QDF71873.1 hypothetical protein FJK96_18075 [Mycobacteroides chelonae]